jgi:hypothetical protein
LIGSGEKAVEMVGAGVVKAGLGWSFYRRSREGERWRRR